MVEIKAKLKVPRAAYKVEVKGLLALPFAGREAGQLHARLASGEEVCLALPRGEVLRGGDLVTASDGRVFEVLAAPERLLHAVFAVAADLAKAAYLLGSRHVPAQVGADWLRVADGREPREMLGKLGAKLTQIEAPFEPEAVAHAGGGHHAHGHACDHGHDHAHGHASDHTHDHGHGHAHDHGDHDHARGRKPRER